MYTDARTHARTHAHAHAHYYRYLSAADGYGGDDKVAAAASDSVYLYNNNIRATAAANHQPTTTTSQHRDSAPSTIARVRVPTSAKPITVYEFAVNTSRLNDARGTTLAVPTIMSAVRS